jgi:vacuolar protein sorting-associated protein 26
MGEVVKEREFWVHSYRMPPDVNTSIKMEVGIEDCLHIEFEYNKAKCVSVRWLALLMAKVPSEGCDCRQDLLLAGAHQDQAHGAFDHPARDDGRRAQPLQRVRDHYQIRDHGWRSCTRCVPLSTCPSTLTAQGETIPIRLFLGGFELTPTFRDVNKKFSTRYYLNLVLIDEENRRYFKQQEITVFRIPSVSTFR